MAGTNVIAVEVHQQSPTSTDVSFDLELRATPTPAQGPTVSLISPVHQSVSNLAGVTFTASASAAAGLANATLFLGDPPTTINFSGPTQIDDAQIVADSPTLADGSGLSLNVDGQSPHAHALVKVPLLVGSGAGQVPPGAMISSATLSLNCTNAGQAMRVYRLTQSWVEGRSDVERASHRPAVGCCGRGRRGIELRRRRHRGLYGARCSTDRSHIDRPGVGERNAEPRHRLRRVRH